MSSDPPSLGSWPTTHLSLASVAPETAAASAYLKGVVSLQWPFSPSSATLSLLVCEEDVRLRASNGQLRVEFRGASAREVDAKKVQIGDHIELSLEGAELEALDNATPRDVPWKMVFSTRMVMKFKTPTGWDSIDIDVPSEEEPTDSFESTLPDEDDAFMYPPAPSTKQPTTPRRQNEWSYKRKGDLLATSPLYLQNLFGDEEYNLEVDVERPRKRPRFGNSYRLVDRTPSPGPEGEDEGEGVQDVFDFMPEIDLEAARLAAMTDEPLVIFQDEPTPDEPMVIFRDQPAPDAGDHSNWMDMPPPPLPPLNTQFNNTEDEIPDSPSLRPAPSPQLPLVSPFLHRGLSEDYVSAGEEIRENASEVLDTQEDAGLRMELQAPMSMPAKGIPRDQEGDEFDDDPFAVVTAISAENSRPTSSAGESEQDSLFDEMSDREDSRTRPRSRSPLPGPSPLRKVQRVKTPERSPTASRSKLRLQITSTTSESPQPGDTPRSAAPKTPYLYLPTPSPKVTSNEHMSFPFSPPSRLDFGRRASEAGDSPRGQKRKLLRQSLDSAPLDLSTYFGRPGPHATEYSVAEEDGLAEAPSSPTAEKGPYKRRNSIHEPHLQRRGSTVHFRSGITTPLSDFPPLVFLSWGATVDLIGVVSQHSPIARAESGQKDYYMALRIVDSSQNTGIVMRIFRPYKNALPEVEVGDVVMLRSFKITSYKHRYVGVSTENSAWAVWKEHGKQRPAVCAGPPVEYGDEEETYVASIGTWYMGLDPQYRETMEHRPKEELVAGIKK